MGIDPQDYYKQQIGQAMAMPDPYAGVADQVGTAIKGYSDNQATHQKQAETQRKQSIEVARSRGLQALQLGRARKAAGDEAGAKSAYDEARAAAMQLDELQGIAAPQYERTAMIERAAPVPGGTVQRTVGDGTKGSAGKEFMPIDWKQQQVNQGTDPALVGSHLAIGGKADFQNLQRGSAVQPTVDGVPFGDAMNGPEMPDRSAAPVKLNEGQILVDPTTHETVAEGNAKTFAPKGAGRGGGGGGRGGSTKMQAKVGGNGNWWNYNPATGDMEDTGVKAPARAGAASGNDEDAAVNNLLKGVKFNNIEDKMAAEGRARRRYQAEHAPKVPAKPAAPPAPKKKSTGYLKGLVGQLKKMPNKI